MKRLTVLVLTAAAIGGCAHASAGSAATSSDSHVVVSGSVGPFSVTTLSMPETFEQGATRLDPVPKSFSPKVTATQAFESLRGQVGDDAANRGEVFLALWTRYDGAGGQPSRRPVWVVHFANVPVAFSTSQAPSDESALTRQVGVYEYVDAVSGTPIQEDDGAVADSPARSWSPLPSPITK